MRHTGDYELDEINMLEQECQDLEEDNKRLEEENADLKSELSKFRDSFKKYRDYEKEELAESCYDLARENEKLKEENRKFKADTEHTIKFNNKIIGKLKLENDKLKVIIKNNDLEQKADWKHIEELEEENKKLKEEIKIYKKQYEHTMGED